MRLCQDQRLILGPPGTGKTTRLLGIVEEELKTVAPNRIAYCSFTKQAVTEAMARACHKFNYKETDLPYFRTLHSICFLLLGLTRKEVMSKAHYDELGESIGYHFSNSQDVIEEGVAASTTDGDKLLFLVGLARNRRVTLEQQWQDINDMDIDLFALQRLAVELTAFKQQRSLLDFTDMLEQILVCQRRAPIDVLVLDEAQDLSPLQWEVCRVIFPTAKRVYIGGDDDQSVHTWAGANVAQFLALEGQREVLQHSYRLPQEIYQLASQTIEKVGQRFIKKWAPRKEQGSVNRLPSLDSVDMEAEGSWMILARNSYLLGEASELLKRAGQPYLSQRGGSSVRPEHYIAIRGWEQLRKGIRVPGSVVRQVYQFLRPGMGIKRGAKAMLDFPDDQTFSMDSLRQNYGLMADGIWHDVLEGIGLNTREYYLAILRAGNKLGALPRIRLSTIHGAKGGEADNVILFSEMSQRTYAHYQHSPDDEIRVFYVGATRAKKRLNIIDSTSLMGFQF